MSTAKNKSNEVKAKRKRRYFTANYKLEVVKKVAECERGEIGEYLRKEGLYQATVRRWQKEYENGTLGERKRGPKKQSNETLEKKISQLEKDKKKLEKRLQQAEAIIEFQKKIAEFLERE